MALTNEQVKQAREKYNITFDTGEDVQEDPSVTSKRRLKSFNDALAEAERLEKLTAPKPEGVKGLAGVAVGAGKEALGTLRGASGLGENIIKGIGRFFTPKGAEEKLGFAKTEKTAAERVIPDEAVTPVGGAEKIGGFAENVAEFAVPISKVSKATQGLGWLQKIIAKSGTAAGVASLQEGKVGKDALVAGTVEAALPGVGKFVAKPAVNIFKRIFKGLGSGLSGASEEVIEQIVKNPKVAREVSKKIAKDGGKEVLESNAKVIANGVSGLRQEARATYGKAMGALKEVDINPKNFRSSMQGFLDSVGSSVKGDTRRLANVEFKDAINLKKASSLIDELAETPLDGKSLSTLLKRIGDARYATAKTTERQAFNAFIDDFGKALNGAIKKSTDKLTKANKAFADDMQLAENIERIFGKVKFKSDKELGVIASKVNKLFDKEALDPATVDRFLKRIGSSADDFRTSEATRQIGTKAGAGNTIGLSWSEIPRAISAAIVNPEAVKDIAIATGLAQEVVERVVKEVSPAFRAIVIKALVEANQEEE